MAIGALFHVVGGGVLMTMGRKSLSWPSICECGRAQAPTDGYAARACNDQHRHDNNHRYDRTLFIACSQAGQRGGTAVGRRRRHPLRGAVCSGTS